MWGWISNMRKFAVIMPGFALIAGVFGFILRRRELETVFDAVTGLPERGAGVTLGLIMLSVAVLVIGLIFSIAAKVKYDSPQGFENAFGTHSVAYPLFFLVIGLLWLAAAVLHFFNRDYTETVAELYFSVLAGLAAISSIFFAVEVYKNPGRKLKLGLSVVPTLFTCFWLILLYRRNASNPVLLTYVYHCLALIAATVSFYLYAGFVFNKSAPGKTIFFCAASIFFCTVTLADEHALWARVILAVIIAVNFVNGAMLIKNLERRNP